MIKLLAPDHPGEGLALDEARVGVGDAVLQLGVKFVRLADGVGRKWRRNRQMVLQPT